MTCLTSSPHRQVCTGLHPAPLTHNPFSVLPPCTHTTHLRSRQATVQGSKSLSSSHEEVIIPAPTLFHTSISSPRIYTSQRTSGRARPECRAQRGCWRTRCGRSRAPSECSRARGRSTAWGQSGEAGLQDIVWKIRNLRMNRTHASGCWVMIHVACSKLAACLDREGIGCGVVSPYYPTPNQVPDITGTPHVAPRVSLSSSSLHLTHTFAIPCSCA